MPDDRSQYHLTMNFLEDKLREYKIIKEIEPLVTDIQDAALVRSKLATLRRVMETELTTALRRDLPNSPSRTP